MPNDEYFKSLSADGLDKAEAIEAEIYAALAEGFTEDLALMFVRAVMALQTAVPGATVWGVFEAALHEGLIDVCKRLRAGDGLPAIKKRRSVHKRGPVRGV